jgi:hypothetical protein
VGSFLALTDNIRLDPCESDKHTSLVQSKKNFEIASVGSFITEVSDAYTDKILTVR